ncbi:MAG TPA: transaldolase family protein [Chlamydiales bacterium]|nr:transaldolase family protein [Chlamydiales bacterium]
MEIWLDTINFQAIEQAESMGLLQGVTTNPAILSEEVGADAATLPVELFTTFIEEEPLSEIATQKLRQKWCHSFGGASVCDIAFQ